MLGGSEGAVGSKRTPAEGPVRMSGMLLLVRVLLLLLPAADEALLIVAGWLGGEERAEEVRTSRCCE